MNELIGEFLESMARALSAGSVEVLQAGFATSMVLYHKSGIAVSPDAARVAAQIGSYRARLAAVGVVRVELGGFECLKGTAQRCVVAASWFYFDAAGRQLFRTENRLFLSNADGNAFRIEIIETLRSDNPALVAVARNRAA